MSIVLSFASLLVGCTAGAPPFPANAPPQAASSWTVLEAGPASTDRASTGGVSWLDVDGDHLPELFVTNGYDVSAEEPSPQANRFYRFDSDGRAMPVAVEGLTDVDGFSSGSTWADADNDGDLDVFVSNQRGQLNFLLFQQSGRFVRALPGPIGVDGGSSYAAAWVDVDGDGRVDLYVANGGLSHSEPNFLYRNLDGERFERVDGTPPVTDVQPSSSAVWADYDNDGDQDLYVANHPFVSGADGSNRLYRNEGGFMFTSIGEGPAVEDADPSLAAAWGDMDNDGDLDLFVGNWAGLADRLYRNRGDGTFERLDGQSVVTDGGSTYAAAWGDTDNDGDLDLVVTHWGAAHVLYLNDGEGRFTRSDEPAFVTRIGYGASVALADMDDDGDLDLYIGHWPNRPGSGEANLLIRNDGATGHWLKVRLEGTVSNGAAIGARITVETNDTGGPVRRIREVTGASSFRSQSDLTQHFGLGNATRIDRLSVRWPSGRMETWIDLDVDQTVRLREGDGA